MISPETLANDAAWLPWDIDAEKRTMTFVHAPKSLQRTATFLDAASLAAAISGPLQQATASLDAIAASVRGMPSHPIHFIFHSAFCCSTLMARALDLPGGFALKEPAIVNVLASRAYAGTLDRATLDLVLSLLARPLEGAVIIVKPSNEANVLATALMEARPSARAIFMSSGLDAFLGSVAGKGLWGRAWVRRIQARDRQSGADVAPASAAESYIETDLQIAGRYWLNQRALAQKLHSRFPGRLAGLDADTLVSDPGPVLRKTCAFLGIEQNAPLIDARVAEVFSLHSKRHATSFGSDSRRREEAKRRELYGDEMGMVGTWVAALASHAGVDYSLPQPLV